MKLVIIESHEANLAYACECQRDSLERGEAPFSPLLHYIQDEIRMSVGLAWARHADLTAVYADLGMSDGMAMAVYEARRAFRRVEVRYIRNHAVAASQSDQFRASLHGMWGRVCCAYCWDDTWDVKADQFGEFGGTPRHVSVQFRRRAR